MPCASAFHRFALIALAIAGRPGYRVSDREVSRAAPSYTVETLRALHQEGWAASQLFFILGTDAFAEIATWREYPAVLDAANFVVLTRPGMRLDDALARTPGLRARARREPSTSPSGPTWIFLVESATRDVSSTEIRRRLAVDESIAGLVPEAVAQHIEAHHLYGTVDTLHG
jgi:nicotinate-nucleotide adenylyltransferase